MSDFGFKFTGKGLVLNLPSGGSVDLGSFALLNAALNSAVLTSPTITTPTVSSPTISAPTMSAPIITGALTFNDWTFTFVDQDTADSTVTPVKTVACPAGAVAGAIVFGVATIKDTSDDGLVALVYNAVKNAAGTTAVVGSTGGSNVESAGGSPAVTVVADDTADTLVVNVTGENAKAYNWKLLIFTVVTHGA